MSKINEILRDLKILHNEVANQFQNASNGIIASSSESLSMSEQVCEKLKSLIKKYDL